MKKYEYVYFTKIVAIDEIKLQLALNQTKPKTTMLNISKLLSNSLRSIVFLRLYSVFNYPE